MMRGMSGRKRPHNTSAKQKWKKERALFFIDHEVFFCTPTFHTQHTRSVTSYEISPRMLIFWRGRHCHYRQGPWGLQEEWKKWNAGKKVTFFMHFSHSASFAPPPFCSLHAFSKFQSECIKIFLTYFGTFRGKTEKETTFRKLCIHIRVGEVNAIVGGT